MTTERSCKTCKHKKWRSWDGWEYCMDWEISACDNETAKNCDHYEYKDWTEEDEEEREYCPSATAGDYSPSHPWDAPGESIHSFI